MKSDFKERPILFSALMVRVILEKQKTQTRRIIKPQPSFPCIQEIELLDVLLYENMLVNCPYGKPGDRLWVRETWRHVISDTHECFAYKADNKYKCGKDAPIDYQPAWKPSIHMPRKACRLVLEMSDIRVERLQDIREEDAIAEGVIKCDDAHHPLAWHNYLNSSDVTGSARMSFASLWESINGAGSWSANPWVWAISFKKLGGDGTAGTFRNCKEHKYEM